MNRAVTVDLRVNSDLFTKFNGNLWDSCSDISIKNKNVSPSQSGAHQSLTDLSSGDHEYLLQTFKHSM